jgi:hypothetical protein
VADEREIEEALRLYETGPDALEAALYGITEEELNSKIRSDGWTLREVVHHIADAESTWMTLVKIITISPSTRFSHAWHPGNKGISRALNYAKRPVEPALALFRATRQHVAQMLRAILGVWENHLVGIEVPDGEPDFTMTVGEYITGMARHLQEHLEEITTRRSQIMETRRH